MKVIHEELGQCLLLLYSRETISGCELALLPYKVEPDSGRFCVNQELLSAIQEFHYVLALCDRDFLQVPGYVLHDS